MVVILEMGRLVVLLRFEQGNIEINKYIIIN